MSEYLPSLLGVCRNVSAAHTPPSLILNRTSINQQNRRELTLKHSLCIYVTAVWQPLKGCQMQLGSESAASLKLQNTELITNQIWSLRQEGLTHIWSLTTYGEIKPCLTLFPPDRLFKSPINADRSAQCRAPCYRTCEASCCYSLRLQWNRFSSGFHLSLQTWKPIIQLPTSGMQYSLDNQ